MTSTTLAWSIAAIAALGAVACFEGESPIVAAEEGGAGSGAAQGAGATGPARLRDGHRSAEEGP